MTRSLHSLPTLLVLTAFLGAGSSLRADAAALPPAVDGQAVPSLAPMLKQVLPAVVSVYSQHTVRVSSPLGPFANDPFFRQIFGIPQVPKERVERALGSGVIIDAQKGYVLTNHHVVENADGVSVTLADGRTVEAEFIGSDPDTDVALIRIPAKDLNGTALTAVPLANSDALQVGDFVVAVGNPYGLGQTVTSGIVSAVGRSGIPVAGYQNYIQTDASINPGNSGGALLNLRGELVGINTASFNPRGSMAGNIGLGFAIPINLARNVEQQLLTTGEVKRGSLGVEAQDLTPQLAKAAKLDNTRGALITQVYPGSAGTKAGLQVGDVVIAANGQRIDNRAALHNFEGLSAVGGKVALDVLRDGKTLQLTTTLQEGLRKLDGGQLDARLQGASFRELDESSLQQLRDQGANGGVQVDSVAQGTRAWNSGLRTGDVVLAASSGDFADLAGFRAGFANKPQQLVLRVLRGGSTGKLLMK